MKEKENCREQEETSEVKIEEPAAEDAESLKEALGEEKAKAERYLANWQRAEADFLNYKKRAEQERSEELKSANIRLILNILPVLDDFERAFNSLPSGLAELTWIDGISLIHRRLWAALQAQGLSEIEAVGEPFDPAFHDAVAQEEGKDGEVIEEVQKGYKLYDRVIRPTLVVVGKSKEAREN